MFPIYLREIRPLEKESELTVQTSLEKKFVSHSRLNLNTYDKTHKNKY